MDSTVLTFLVSLFTGGLAWIGGIAYQKAKVKKTKTETEGLHLGNVDKAVGIWEKLYDKLKIELDGVQKQVIILINENEKLHQEVATLRGENFKLQQDVEKLTALIGKK